MVYTDGEKVDFQLEYPFRFLISGSSQTGKSYFIEKLLKQELCKNIRKIYYFGENNHSKYKSYIGLPRDTDFPRHSCIIIDNLFEEAIDSRIVQKLFKYSAESKISIFLTTQNILVRGRYSNWIQNNCNYLVLFSNTTRILNRQIATDRGLEIAYKVAFDFVKNRPHSTIIFNQSQRSPVNLKLFTYISDRKIESFSVDGKLSYLFTKRELEKYCDITDIDSKHFCALNNEDPENGIEST